MKCVRSQIVKREEIKGKRERKKKREKSHVNLLLKSNVCLKTFLFKIFLFKNIFV